jgi:hydroxymethylbilane synthase
MSSHIRIATRGSALAQWQANAVKMQLEAIGHSCEIVTIRSSGDHRQQRPVYEMGITGIFVKELDEALLSHAADIAVHSLKDVPTQLAEELHLAAVLQRGSYQDVAVMKSADIIHHGSKAIVATGSVRRKAQWLARFPGHTVVPIRGNVDRRMQKFFNEIQADVLILAKAALERLKLWPQHVVELEWMLPAPAQGIIGIVCRKEDMPIRNLCAALNHTESYIAATIERSFMNMLMGGCSVPVGALARFEGNVFLFHGAVYAADGSVFYEIKESVLPDHWENAGREIALRLLKQEGVSALIERFSKNR